MDPSMAVIVQFHHGQTEDGKVVLSKEVLITIDDKNHSITLKMIEGLLMESHKSFKFIVQATPKDEGSLVHWTLIHEKLNVDVPDLNTMLQFTIDQTKDVDAHPTQV
uniref:Bet v I/Major latex protein domain-containing protein n=1 Tax=Quercus lobata TaxID=97700 RepID=A0A7N2LNW9_QUELO